MVDQHWGPQSTASSHSSLADPLLIRFGLPGTHFRQFLCAAAPRCLCIYLWSWYSRYDLPLSASPRMLEIQNLRSHPWICCDEIPTKVDIPWLGPQAPPNLAQVAFQPYFLFPVHCILAKQNVESRGSSLILLFELICPFFTSLRVSTIPVF